MDAGEEDGRATIQRFIEDFGRDFRDRVSVSRSTGRALKLYERSGLDLDAFLKRMYSARATTKAHSPSGSKMAYFFACLEDLAKPT